MSRLLLAILLPFTLAACAANNSSNEQNLTFAFLQPAPAADDEPIASARGPGSCALFRDALDRAEAKLSDSPRGF